MPDSDSRPPFLWDDVGGIAVLRFTTDVLRDERIIRAVFDSVDSLIETGRTKIVIDFSGVKGFASYAIGKLIRLDNRLQPPAGRVVLCGLTPVINEIVDLMNLRRRLTIRDTEREALESFV